MQVPRSIKSPTMVATASMALASIILTAVHAVVLCGAAAAADDHPGGLSDLRVAHGDKNILEAWLADPTTRYRHFVLGARYEAASLVVRLRDGRTSKLTLPESSVFEDRQPRLADLDGDGADEIVIVHTYLDRGSSLAVVGIRDHQLQIIAETKPTGTPHTWLNPAGIADFDGDGRLDIAYVQMPHVLGLLHVMSLRDGKLVEIASVPGVANHVAGTPHLGLSAVADFDGDGVADLAIPSLDRRTLRFLSFKGGAHELGRRSLPAAAIGDLALEGGPGKPVVVVGLTGARSVRVGL